MRRFVKKLLSSFAVRVFIAVFCCAIIPFYIIFIWIKSGYEDYMKEDYCRTMVQVISNGEQGINSVFDKMANLSNVIVFDKALTQAFQEGNGESEGADRSLDEYYENYKVVDATLSQMVINNFVNMDDMVVTIFDNKKRIYTNWMTGYNDYDFLLETPWVLQAQQAKGHIFWDLFSPGYIKGDEEKYISLARGIFSNGTEGDYLGVVIISVRQKVLSEILRQYLFDATDCVYVCDSAGHGILNIDPTEKISDQKLSEAIAASVANRANGAVIPVGEDRYLVSTYDISRFGFLDLDMLRVVHFTNYNQIEEQIAGISQKINIYLVLGFIISVIVSVILAKYVVRPINLLARQIDAYTIDGEVTMLDMKRTDEIGHLNRSYEIMSQRIKKLFEDLNHEYEIKEQYRYESLRAKINPHFLFNTLNTIRWMAIIRKADNITQTIDALAGMLSYSMSKDGEIVTLGRELENIRNYVFIQNCRYGNDYQVDFQIDEALKQLKVVRFILQPIVENCMAHAFRDMSGDARIIISAELKEEVLKIYVKDNGVGMTKAQVEQLNNREQYRNDEKFTGIGYANVDERIRVAYGNGFGLSVESSPGNGVEVIYTLPVIR